MTEDSTTERGPRPSNDKPLGPEKTEPRGIFLAEAIMARWLAAGHCAL